MTFSAVTAFCVVINGQITDQCYAIYGTNMTFETEASCMSAINDSKQDQTVVAFGLDSLANKYGIAKLPDADVSGYCPDTKDLSKFMKDRFGRSIDDSA